MTDARDGAGALHCRCPHTPMPPWRNHHLKVHVCSQDEGGLRVLLIDNVSAFYWVDRSVRVPAGQPAEGTLTLQGVHTAAVARLAEVRSLGRSLQSVVRQLAARAWGQGQGSDSGT